MAGLELMRGEVMTTSPVGKSVVSDIVRNNLALQKVSLQLIEAVQQMTERMDRLLGLFEEAAKNIERTQVKEPLTKQLEELLEQNKTIARGLVLIEKFVRDKTSVGFESSDQLGAKRLPRL